MESTQTLLGTHDGRERHRAFKAILVGALLVIAIGIGLAIRSAAAEPSFIERHRSDAEAFCRVDPELKFRKYPLADGTDPAPHLDAFEYCVAAYISHLPED